MHITLCIINEPCLFNKLSGYLYSDILHILHKSTNIYHGGIERNLKKLVGCHSNVSIFDSVVIPVVQVATAGTQHILRRNTHATPIQLNLDHVAVTALYEPTLCGIWEHPDGSSPK